ncbi:MAG: glycosyltransferase [Candidatus Odinarchaeota archaeon]
MINKSPLVTIFTPNFNNSKYISETIESIINQDYSNFEYLIIDDCSSDSSWEIIQNYAEKDKRIKIIRNKRNLGIVRTRNKGFLNRSSRSKYFAILDSDDVSLLNRLKIQVEFLEKNQDYGLVGSNVLIIDENSKVIGYREYPASDNKIRKKITRYNPFTQSSIILRTEIIDQIGLYDENWHVCQDYDYWLRIGIRWKLANVDKPLIKYRISKTQVKFKNLKETLLNTYLIQVNAIKNYGYQDNIRNIVHRILLKSLLILPKIAYYLYKARLKLKRFI